jgi:type II secretory pathway component GspD/PulD (secretin)
MKNRKKQRLKWVLLLCFLLGGLSTYADAQTVSKVIDVSWHLPEDGVASIYILTTGRVTYDTEEAADRSGKNVLTVRLHDAELAWSDLQKEALPLHADFIDTVTIEQEDLWANKVKLTARYDGDATATVTAGEGQRSLFIEIERGHVTMLEDHKKGDQRQRGAMVDRVCKEIMEASAQNQDRLEEKKEKMLQRQLGAEVEGEASGVLPARESLEELDELAATKVTIDLLEADIKDALIILGEQANLNVIFDPSVAGKVNIRLRDVALKDALYLVLSAHDLDYRKINNSLLIAPAAKIKQQLMLTETIKLKHVNASAVKSLLEGVIDKSLIKANDETNNLVLSGAPNQIAEAQRIVRNVDTPRPQVLLNARILEISMDGEEKLGINWDDSEKVTFTESERLLEMADPAGIVGPTLRIYKMARSAISINATINLLESEEKARTLSNPSITAMNGKEANIFIGDRVPYEITTVTGGVASTEVRYVEPGIRLTITPEIIEKDFVVIKIEPEVSFIFAWRGEDENYPWVRTREATAYVRVKDGETFVLGGLLSDEDKVDVEKVPFLSSIPFFGELFKSSTTTKVEKDLLIVVTPVVMSESSL